MLKNSLIVLSVGLLVACSGVDSKLDKKQASPIKQALQQCAITDFATAYAQLSQPAQWPDLQCALQSLQTIEQAQKIQWDYAAQRSRQQAIVGYKVALGSVNAQQLFALPEPVVGIMFDKALFANNTTIAISSAVNLAFEPDLLAVVKSADINQAKTIQELAPHIDKLVAFLEVPDLLIKPGPNAGPAFIASNAAFKWGVMGDSITARSDAAFLESLQTMQVTAFDGTSQQVLSTAKGSAVMGHPYNAIVFLIAQLQQRGLSLAAGDVISLGAYASPKPLADINRVRVEYSGIDGSQTLSVSASFQP